MGDDVRLGVFITWRPGSEMAMIASFMTKAPEWLGEGPFLSVECGASVISAPTPDKRSDKGAILADWGFVAEMAAPSDALRWKESPAHIEMEAELASILGSMTVLCW
jgi:hypothetical protein